jgi:AcrR family transcriptional regulator
MAVLRDEEPSWREKRRGKILAAARRLFARTPYELVQMDDVAASAQVGKSTLYRYFPSKDELYLEVCALAFDELALNFRAAAALPPSQALSKMIRALIDVLASQVASLRLLSGERAPVAEGWRRLYYLQRRAIIDAFRHVLAFGVERGDFRAMDVELTAQLVVGMVRGGLAMVGSSNRDSMTGLTLGIILNGIESAQMADLRIKDRRARTKRSHKSRSLA